MGIYGIFFMRKKKVSIFEKQFSKRLRPDSSAKWDGMGLWKVLGSTPNMDRKEKKLTY